MIHIHTGEGQQFDLNDDDLVPVLGRQKPAKDIKKGDMIRTSERVSTLDWIGDVRPVYLLVILVRKGAD